MEGKKTGKLHKIVVTELLSTIDHKVRGVQQFIIALRGLVEADILKDLTEEIEELQELYEPYLKARNLNFEKFKMGEFLKDNYNIKTDFSGSVELDKERLKFIFDTLIELSGGNYKLLVGSTGEDCIVRFISPAFVNLSLKDFDTPPKQINDLPLFAVRKTFNRMEGEFFLDDEEIKMVFSLVT